MGTNWNNIGRAGRARHARDQLARRHGIDLSRQHLKRLAAFLGGRRPGPAGDPGATARFLKRVNWRQEVWLVHPAVLGLHGPGPGAGPDGSQGQGGPHWIKVVYDRHRGRVATVLTAAEPHEP